MNKAFCVKGQGNNSALFYRRIWNGFVLDAALDEGKKNDGEGKIFDACVESGEIVVDAVEQNGKYISDDT